MCETYVVIRTPVYKSQHNRYCSLAKQLLCFMLLILLLSMMTGCKSDASDVKKTDAPQEILPYENNVQDSIQDNAIFSDSFSKQGLGGKSASEPKDTSLSKAGDIGTTVPAASTKNVANDTGSKKDSTNTSRDVNKQEVSVNVPKEKTSAVQEGYRAVAFDGTSFLAVGTGGRIDRIKTDKKVISVSSSTKENINGVASINGVNVAVGDKGIILVAKNGGDFRAVKSGTKKNLYDITVFRNTFLAAGADGIMLYSSDGEKWTQYQTQIKNDIISISANDRMCMAVTREGQILMSSKTGLWNVLDYNEVYKGYSPPYWFNSIRACGEVFFIAGQHQENPDVPVILSSNTGEVWMEHILGDINGQPAEAFLPIHINVIGMEWNKLVALANKGKFITISDCVTCNELDKLTDRSLIDMAGAGGYTIIVGDDFWFDILENKDYKKYHIEAEQALEAYNKGAFIIDVRDEPEYEEAHIRGCIHIPLEYLESTLTTRIPNRLAKIIFYSGSNDMGARAQKAVEQAIMYGYKDVHNLGSINDWPYDKVSGTEGSFYNQ